MGRALRTSVIMLVTAVLAAGCTVKKTSVPALAGPSGLGLSLSVTATPDAIYQDGSSQSVIAVVARDADGAPVPNLVLQLAISMDGVVGDVGTLTNKRPVTGSDGRATAIYTGPDSTDSVARTVAILATAVGTDYANSSMPRSVQIRLLPVGTVPPPSGLVAGFTVTPATTPTYTWVAFNAPACTADGETGCTQGTIVSYAWNFGDGTTGAGQAVQHVFTSVGSYVVTLTVTGGIGQTATATRVVVVTQ
jgi:PKD repeat protein